jgi:hypothetical protein
MIAAMTASVPAGLLHSQEVDIAFLVFTLVCCGKLLPRQKMLLDR